MALREALANAAANYRFHCSVKGSRAERLAYLTLYYLLFMGLRWGQRHRRCLAVLRRLGFSCHPVEVQTPDAVRLRMDLHTAFDPLFSIFGAREYCQVEGFEPAPGQVVLDVGANVGVYTAFAARRVGERGRVVAVEPHPENCRMLRENIARNGWRHASAVQAAAGDRAGSAQLFIHEFGINHSLRRRSGEAVTVPVRTLDEIAQDCGLERLDLVKIDTEGTVPEVLRGAQGLLARYGPRIVIERDPQEESVGLDELLSGSGYRQRQWRCFTYAWREDARRP